MPFSCIRFFGAAAAVGSLALVMTARVPSMETLGLGIAGLFLCLLTRLAPRPVNAPAPPREIQAQPAPDFVALSEAVAAVYREGGVHPILSANIRRDAAANAG